MASTIESVLPAPDILLETAPNSESSEEELKTLVSEWKEHFLRWLNKSSLRREEQLFYQDIVDQINSKYTYVFCNQIRPHVKKSFKKDRFRIEPFSITYKDKRIELPGTVYGSDVPLENAVNDLLRHLLCIALEKRG